MSRLHHCLVVVIVLVVLGMTGTATATEELTVTTGVDFYSRYNWRGLDIADTPSVQPLLSLGYWGFELGVWGAYTLSNQNSSSDEIDLWLSYTKGWESGAAITLIATDYYFPNSGHRFFDFGGYDIGPFGNPDAGAHTLETGLSLTGPNSFPLTLSGYVNIHNDPANSAYFQVDYPLTAGEYELGLFCGAALGGSDNPGYYGTDGFDVINLGVSASRDIVASESFSLPLVVSLINNPRAEITHLVVGVSF